MPRETSTGDVLGPKGPTPHQRTFVSFANMLPLGVIVPAFNEARRLGDVLGSMPRTVENAEVEVIVVDDGSSDGTGDVARSHGVTVITQTPNQGKGAALCRGLDYVRVHGFEAMVWMDADGQHLPSSLRDLVRPVVAEGFDLCVGSRYLDSHQPSSAPLNRRLVRKATVRAVERITGFPVTDPFSGYRCFSKAAIDVLELEGCGYESELESTFAVARAGLSFVEIPIPRIYGPDTSKMAHRGRFEVITGYSRTIRDARRQTRIQRQVEPVA